MIFSRNILLPLTAANVTLDTWEAERWDWEDTHGLALYPIDFDDHTVKVLQRLAHIAGLPWNEIRNDSVYLFLPDDDTEAPTLQFLEPIGGFPDLELGLPGMTLQQRTEIRILHLPTVQPVEIKA